MLLSLQVSTREAMTAQCSAPPSEPAKSAFFRVRCQGSDGALDDVVVQLDAAVVEEQGQPLPARERIADRLGQLGLLADQSQLLAQPWLHGLDDRPALLLARNPALIRGSAADRSLEAIELGDALQGLAGDRRGTALSELIEAAAHVSPAERQIHGVASG